MYLRINIQALRSVEYDLREMREFDEDRVKEISNVETRLVDKQSWLERYKLFSVSPVTIFVIDAIVQVPL